MTLSLLVRLAVPLALCACGAAGLEERQAWTTGVLANAMAPERPTIAGANSEQGHRGGGGAGALPMGLRAEHKTMQRE